MLVELRSTQVPLAGIRFAGDLIPAEDLQEIEMPGFTAVGLGQAGIETFQPPDKRRGPRRYLGLLT